MTLLVVFWGAKEVLGLMREKGSGQECFPFPQHWNPDDKNLFPSTQILGSCGLNVVNG